MSANAQTTEDVESEEVIHAELAPLDENRKATGKRESPWLTRRKRLDEALSAQLDRLANTRARGGKLGRPHVWIGPLLEALRTVPVIDKAAKLAGISSDTVHYWRQRVPAIETEIHKAMECGIDRLEAAAYQRAVEGHQRPIYQGGSKVGEETVYSDRLAELILKGRRRAVYGDKTELTGAGGGPLQVVIAVPQPVKRGRVEAQAEIEPPSSTDDEQR